MSAKSPQKQHFPPPDTHMYLHNNTLTENFLCETKGQSLRERAIKSRYQIKIFNIQSNTARNLENTEATRGFR